MTKVAALFVDPNGVYANLPDVEVWGEERDARLYEGPWPVVAHPPCARWSLMGNCRPEFKRGDDGGCFAAALRAVREFGGVLEHPAHSYAWAEFELPYPSRNGWAQSMLDPGWATWVDQRSYGHNVRKPTWLYYVGAEPARMLWASAEPSEMSSRGGRKGYGPHKSTHNNHHMRAATPIAFRDVLLAMARSAAALRLEEQR